MNENKFMEMLKVDAVDAGYRVASTQMTSAIRKGLLKLFQDKGMDGDKLSMLSEVLDSEVGASLISLMLGFGLNYVPHYSDDPRVSRLAEEFRIAGMATAGNAVVDTALQYFVPALTTALETLPKEVEPKKVRFDNKVSEALEEMNAESELEEEEDKNLKRMSCDKKM